MKTLEVEWLERKRATVNVPDTYDPAPHLDELAALVGEIEAEDVIEDSRGELVWKVIDHDPHAPVLVASDPDAALYTGVLVERDADNVTPLRQWSTPAPRHVILAACVEHLNAHGELLQADATARIYDRYPVIRPGTRPYVAWLLLTAEPEPGQP